MSRVVGLGLDVVEVARVAGALERHGERLEGRICRPGESRPLGGRARAAHLAGLFAAKEAVMKALGSGWGEGVGFRQIEIGRSPAGAPTVRLHGEAARRARALGAEAVSVSITHDGGVAAAVAVLEGHGAATGHESEETIGAR